VRVTSPVAVRAITPQNAGLRIAAGVDLPSAITGVFTTAGIRLRRGPGADETNQAHT
jgi:hypothetical protein